MHHGPYNLAIETTGPRGSVTLGRGDEPLATADLPPQSRHRVELMPTIDRVFKQFGVQPRELAEVYLSIGPGSFTGLRIAVATAKLLAQVLGVRLVAVPTLDVVAQNAPRPSAERADTPPTAEHLAVALAHKGNRIYGGYFRFSGGFWVRCGEPRLATVEDWIAAAPRPTSVIIGHDAAVPTQVASDICVLPPESAVGRSTAVWRLGRAAAQRDQFVPPHALLPLYVRPPEAEELWDQRYRYPHADPKGVTPARPTTDHPESPVWPAQTREAPVEVRRP